MNASVHTMPSMDGYVFRRLQPRLVTACLISLFFHAFILSLQFGVPGIGLPGLQAFWSERRAQDVSVTLMPADASRPEGPAAAASSFTDDSRGTDIDSLGTPAPSAAASLLLPNLPSSGAPHATPVSSLMIYPFEAFDQPAAQEQDNLPASTAGKPSSKHAASGKRSRRAEERKHAQTIAKKKSPRSQARSTTSQPVIALDRAQEDAFTVPVPDIAEHRTEHQAEPNGVPAEPHQAHVSAEQTEPLQAAAAADEVDPAEPGQEDTVHSQAASTQQEEARAKEQALSLQMQQAEAEQRMREEETRLAELEFAKKLAEKQEQQRAQERLAQLQNEEAAREHAHRQLEAQRQADELHQQRVAQLAEERRIQAEQARQLADLKQAEEAARRQAIAVEEKRQAEQTAQQLARRQEEEETRRMQLAAQQQQEEANRKARELVAQRQAEQLAQEQAAHLQNAQKLREEAALQAQQAEMKRQAEQLAQEQAAQRLREEAAMQAQQAQQAQYAEMKRLEAARARAAQAEKQLQGQIATSQVSAMPSRSGAAASQGASSGGSNVGAEDKDIRSGGHSAGRDAGTPEDTSAGMSAAQTSTDTAKTDDKPSKQPQEESGPIMLTDDQLDSLKAVQVKNVRKDRLEPWEKRELETAMQESRRRTIFGKADDDLALKMYLDDWNRQVERTVAQNHSGFARPPSQHPIVTVAIRSDGSVENIAVNRSSGELEIDQAIARLIGLASYTAFPPNLARRYDVIEIRRLWQFEERLHLLEASR